MLGSYSSYSLRRRIEDWHRILTSGRDAEKIARSPAARTKRSVTIISVIAWLLAAPTLMGHRVPQLAAKKMSARSELAMRTNRAGELELGLASREQASGFPDLAVVSLGEALVLVVRLDGCLCRKRDAPTGNKWCGKKFLPTATGAQTTECIVKRGNESTLCSPIVKRRNDQ